jgi:hypothetical protein
MLFGTFPASRGKKRDDSCGFVYKSKLSIVYNCLQE